MENTFVPLPTSVTPPEITPPTSSTPAFNPPLPEKTKGALRKRIKIGIAIGFVLIVGLFFSIKYLAERTKPATDKVKIVEEPKETTQSTGSDDPIKTYQNDTYKFMFKYSRDAVLEDFSPIQSDPKSMRVYYAPNQIDFNEDTLAQGYVFKVLIHKSLAGKMEEITKRKSDSYKQSCRSTPKVSEIQKTTFDDYAALIFTVEGCPMDYREMFLQKNSNYIEVIQMYAGDIGYKQKYKSTTDEILGTLNFYEDIAPELLNNDLFRSDKFGFSFLHPKLDSTCCNILGPVKGKTEKLVVLARHPKTGTINDKKFDGLAVYEEENYAKQSFDEYVSDQKLAYIADYKLVVGKEPITSEKKIKVGKRDGVILMGYAWWADVVLVPLTVQSAGINYPRFLVILKTEEKPGSFTETFEKILESFKFD